MFVVAHIHSVGLSSNVVIFSPIFVSLHFILRMFGANYIYRPSFVALWSFRVSVIFDHPRSGVVYNFGRVCLSVCPSVRRQLSKAVT